MPRSADVRVVTVLQHVPFEGPAAIGDWAERRGHALRRVALHAGKPVPAAATIDALVVMGGPMGVADGERFPFLREERRLLLDCVTAGRPVLGVCLGAQLLADALGARVRPQGYREIGWFPLSWSARAHEVPAFAHVPAASVVFHWHGDTFETPAGFVPLASSAGCPNQAFASADGRLIGLQFHLEMRGEDVQQLVLHGRDELTPGPHVQAETELTAGAARHAVPLGPLLETMLDRWLATADRPASSRS